MSNPSVGTQIFNLAKALRDFVKYPSFVSKEDYEKRLQICDTCDKRNNESCSVCGCFLAYKARPASQHCPLNKWPGDVDQAGS